MRPTKVKKTRSRYTRRDRTDDGQTKTRSDTAARRPGEKVPISCRQPTSERLCPEGRSTLVSQTFVMADRGPAQRNTLTAGNPWRSRAAAHSANDMARDENNTKGKKEKLYRLRENGLADGLQRQPPDSRTPKNRTRQPTFPNRLSSFKAKQTSERISFRCPGRSTRRAINDDLSSYIVVIKEGGIRRSFGWRTICDSEIRGPYSTHPG